MYKSVVLHHSYNKELKVNPDVTESTLYKDSFSLY